MDVHSAKRALANDLMVTLPGYDASSSTPERRTRLQRLINIITEEDPEFVLIAAAYSRNELNLRNTPLTILALASFDERLKKYVPTWSQHIIKRADDILFLVNWIKNEMFNGGRCHIPNCLKNGMLEAFNRFDEYQHVGGNINHEYRKKTIRTIISNSI